MDRRIAMLLIGLVLGGGIGFIAAASQNVTLDGHDHADPAQHAGSGEMPAHEHHGAIELEGGPESPKLEISLEPDPDSGWNLHVMVENFRFAPENAGTAHRPGEGHAHIYVNGEKIARQYGEWFHIAAMPEGRNEIAVTLNSNDHRELQVDGEPVRASVMVVAE